MNDVNPLKHIFLFTQFINLEYFYQIYRDGGMGATKIGVCNVCIFSFWNIISKKSFVHYTVIISDFRSYTSICKNKKIVDDPIITVFSKNSFS